MDERTDSTAEHWFCETAGGWRVPLEIKRGESDDDPEFWRSSTAPRSAFLGGIEIFDGGDPEEVAPGVFQIRVLVYRDEGEARSAAERIAEEWRRPGRATGASASRRTAAGRRPRPTEYSLTYEEAIAWLHGDRSPRNQFAGYEDPCRPGSFAIAQAAQEVADAARTAQALMALKAENEIPEFWLRRESRPDSKDDSK